MMLCIFYSLAIIAVQVHGVSQVEPMSSIFDISYEMNGPLPFYHPDHLIHYIMWGKMDLVHSVLISLYTFFKQFVDDEDNIINEYPPVSFSKMLKLQNVTDGMDTHASCLLTMSIGQIKQECQTRIQWAFRG